MLLPSSPNFTDSIPCGPRFHRMWATVPFDVGRDSSENQNADRFTTESRTASRGISGPLAVESPDHFDRNTHPFKGLGFNNPTPQTEDLYIKSINKTTDSYRALLEEVRAGKLVLPNCNLDDGSKTKAGEYSLADESYASLLAELSAKQFNLTSPQLRDNIVDFYSDLSLPIETRENASRWQGVLSDLSQLKSTSLPPPVADEAAH